MKRKIRKWALRIGATIGFIILLLIVIVLNPILSYANKTRVDQYSIYHNKTLDSFFIQRLQASIALVRESEYYTPKVQLDICVNDGSRYPQILRALKGPAFAWGFYDKVVLFGTANCQNNYVELNGYRWNLSQLIAHEMMHCYQFKKRGFWKSNPVAGIDNWKWEGYPEYVARQNEDQKNLEKNIDRLIATEKTDHNGWIVFGDGTGTVISYYKSWLLIQYCIEVKKMDYDAIIKDTTTEDIQWEEMMKWYKEEKQAAINSE